MMVLSVLVATINSAQALECQIAAQSRGAHWAWRLIDGRKCWYKGASGMDKAVLHWPTRDESIDQLTATLDNPKGGSVLRSPEAQSIAPEILQTLPIMPLRPSFEDRWRLL
jgi:hypothetical protein